MLGMRGSVWGGKSRVGDEGEGMRVERMVGNARVGMVGKDRRCQGRYGSGA